MKESLIECTENETTVQNLGAENERMEENSMTKEENFEKLEETTRPSLDILDEEEEPTFFPIEDERNVDDLLNEELENAFDKETSRVMLHEVAKIATVHDPIDLAYAVSRLPLSARAVVFENLPDTNAKIIFMIHTGNLTRSTIFRQIDNEEIKKILERMPPDEAASMTEDMSDRRLKKVLDLMDAKKAERIRELLRHGRNTAGRLMSNEFFSFGMNQTIGEIKAIIRDNPGIPLAESIFVLSEEGELVGAVPERNMIVNPDYLPLRQVVRPILHKVHPETDRDEVVDLVERYKIPSLPVVNEAGALIGVINYEDVVEAMEDIADETIANFAGTGEKIEENEPVATKVLLRAPWLLITLCAGLINAAAISHFNARVWFTFVPFFVPLITGMSGNVGLQCSTILVRGMSLGQLTPGRRKEAMRKELTIGLLIGSLFGLVCASLVGIGYFIGFGAGEQEALFLGATLSAGVFGACMTATVLGTFSPFTFSKLGIDPAVASGPIVTAFNDVISTLMFFFVAWGVSIFFHV